jgi:hypothetical protein
MHKSALDVLRAFAAPGCNGQHAGKRVSDLVEDAKIAAIFSFVTSGLKRIKTM